MGKHVWRIAVIAALLLARVSAAPTSAAEESPPPHLGYGMMLAYPPGSLTKVKEAGFGWFKHFIYWDSIEPDHNGVYQWASVDALLNLACQNGLSLLMRVERHATNWKPIQDNEMAAWQAFFQALAARIRQKRTACGQPYRVALEIWNEPNLDFQWNYEPVDPVRYTEMVKRAYLGAKAADHTIPIVAGSLAPTGGWEGGRAMNDVAFLEAMYDNGLSGHFDAISIHNYGYGGEPEDKNHGWNILNFRRAEDIYAVMVAHGDGDKSVWATEFGWLLNAGEEGHAECLPYWDSIGFGWQKVSAAQQADYLQRAFAYADAHWPWMGGMFVSNLDFSATGWYPTCDPLNWFSVLTFENSPRLAYTALQNMPKRPLPPTASRMSVNPQALTWRMRLRERDVLTTTVSVLSDNLPFTWTVVTATQGLPFTVTPTMGTSDGTFQVQADARYLQVGAYTGTLTVHTADAEVLPRAITLPLQLEIWGMWGMAVHPPTLSWMMALSETHPLSATVGVENTGDFPFEWEVSAASESLTMTVVPTGSIQTGSTFISGVFTVFVDPRGLPLGLYTGTLTVTASEAQVPQSPFVVPVSVRLVERLYRLYMPLVMRRF